MTFKTTIALLAVGLVLGLVIGYPLARLQQPVKTVTKTKVLTQVSKVGSGLTLEELAKRLGPPDGEVQSASADNNYVECIGWSGPSKHAITSPNDWQLALCAKVK